MSKDLKIGIILGSTREGRVSPFVGEWVKGLTESFGQASYEVVDVKSFNLPLLGESADMSGIMAWNEKLASLDGFIFVVSEYNHSIAASLKNALDLARDPWANKAAGIVSYGSVGGARAAEHLRGILGELQVADVRSHVTLSLFDDFTPEGFKPRAVHEAAVKDQVTQLENWAKALKTIR
ncbi:NADPH-dependent FMN reductase [Paracholeplasma brassicae]|uniref:NADPH-dependent FMN reductase n=1 Tax=Acholeplasma brassicae TaxID=61635 RepID=U4KQ21_9MOLU|nr:NADPH-dependent FMN reductase [Paracholeplasma brassicae]CCV66471.1 NADPH-dependent FMN reductase [Paracholeplasma brassicae]